MKDFLISFMYGLCASVMIGGAGWLLLLLLGGDFVAVVLLLIIIWGLGRSIRDYKEDMKEDR